jgi:16S rRNA U1498 N3-methylase RsmE
MGLSAYKIYCDPQGVPLVQCIEQVHALKPATLVIMSGPEADLTQPEKSMLRSKGVIFCALTPTILRSFQAITLSAGIFRAIAPQGKQSK